jgi:hypothetical protein
MEPRAGPDTKLPKSSSPLSVQPPPREEADPAAMRLIVAAMSRRPERDPTDFLAACVGFSPGG